jgi:hypothetical protein
MGKTITTEEFFEQYKPIKNHFVQETAYNDCVFETYDKEVQYIVDIANSNKKQCVWTLIDCEDEETWIIPGYHYVNRNGYFITEIPWEDEHGIQVNDNEMCTIDEAIDYCIDFAKEYLKINLDRYNVNTYFLNKIKSTLNNEITLGQAKYIAIDYYNYALNVDIDGIEDEIHNYYSQLS